MPVHGTSSTRNARWILLYGAPKIGKTLTCTTFSAQAPEKLPADKLTRIEDGYWAVFDREGTETLTNFKLEVDQIDLSVDMGDFDKLLKGCKEFHATLSERVKSGKTKYVVIDTYTAFDEAINTHLRKQIDQASNPAPFSNAMLARHMDFINPLRDLPVTVIFVAHAKSNVPFMDGKEGESERIRRAASAMSGDGGKMTTALGSRLGNFLKGQAGYILPMVALAEKGKETKRFIMPYGGRGYEGGGRAPPGLDQDEPAHLGKLFEKIRSLAA
jgi:hypothetical protein